MNVELLKQIKEAIEEYATIIIFPHARPDGDCIGTSFGLKDMIEQTYPSKKVYVSGESSEFTKYIGTPELVDETVLEGALAIAVDTGNSSRLADQRYSQCEKLIKIDHHIPVEDYGDICYVDTGRPAATLIILDLYMLFKDEFKMSVKGAEALFFGTLTDTGRFKYSGVDGDTFRNVAELYDLGLEPKDLYTYLDQKTEELTRFKGFFLQNYEKTENGVAFFKIKPEYLEQFGVTLDEASSLVNELSSFKDCPVWILFAEYEEQIVRARIRSRGIAINELAGRFDGGGHKNACGANLGTWERAEELLKEADQLVKEYKESI